MSRVRVGVLKYHEDATKKVRVNRGAYEKDVEDPYNTKSSSSDRMTQFDCSCNLSAFVMITHLTLEGVSKVSLHFTDFFNRLLAASIKHGTS